MDSPSWYLDPLVARQKRRVHQQLIRHWIGDAFAGLLLKTDLFEEAYGEDQILLDLFPDARLAIGIDLAPATVRAAATRSPLAPASFIVSDVRSLPFRAETVDLIVSNSTLDHFETEIEFRAALHELVRILRPDGRLFITMDNPRNPFYLPLRWVMRLPGAPFRLGYTTSLSQLRRSLEEAGLEVTATGTLLHNPRVLSTALFLALRRLLGVRANGPIRAMLALFAALGRLPTREFTACFVAACGRKRLSNAVR